MLGNRLKTCLLAIVLLYGFGHTAAFASTYGRSAQPSSWGYQSVCGSMTSGNSLNTAYQSSVGCTSNSNYTVYGGNPNYNSGSPFGSTAKSMSSLPTFKFQSTSSIINSLDRTNLDMMMDNGGTRDSSPWDWSEDDNPIGEVDDPVPAGDTPWLIMLLFAAGYIVFRYLRTQRQ